MPCKRLSGWRRVDRPINPARVINTQIIFLPKGIALAFLNDQLLKMIGDLALFEHFVEVLQRHPDVRLVFLDRAPRVQRA